MAFDASKKLKIVKLLEDKGIADYGFVNAEPFIGYARFIVEQHGPFATYFDIGYNRNMDEPSFYEPGMHLEGAKSIITCILPYHLDKPTRLDKGRDLLRISKASIFKDYHQLMQDKMACIVAMIEELGGSALSFCDTGPLNDKAVLLRTGKFKVLNNSLLCHKTYGSRFYIGYIITDLDLVDSKDHVRYGEYGITDEVTGMGVSETDYEALYHPFCKSCGRCAKACPNGAIKVHGHLDSQKCISFLTQSKEWSELDGLTLDGYVYGCDICQMVCPLNGKDLSADFSYPSIIDETVHEDTVRAMTNREFRQSYGLSSVGWIGKKRFLRNIDEIKRNSIRNSSIESKYIMKRQDEQ